MEPAEAASGSVGGVVPIVKPAPPAHLVDATHAEFLAQGDSLKAELAADKAKRDQISAAGREIQEALALCVHERHFGDAAKAHDRLRSATEMCASQLELVEPMSELRFVLTHAMQALACAQTFESFLVTGTLGVRPWPSASWTPLAPGDSSPLVAPENARVCFLDTEWLHGMISAAHEIGRYASRRAAAGDVASVIAAAAAVSALQEGLMAFNLRNSPLRQAFDSVKYIVRRLEDTLYELALFDDEAAAAAAAPRPPASRLIDSPSLTAARLAYEAEDEAREGAIKRARDVQKLAKNAIYTLHRGEGARATEQLKQATEIATSILATACNTHRSLRGAPFVRGMLEELVEARLFAHWLTSAALLSKDDPEFAGLGLQHDEYLGGLGDLIGEIGRVAVAKATARDEGTVRAARGTALAVQAVALTLGSVWPRRVEGKLAALRTAVVKLDQLIYEHALRERSGRRTQQVEWQPEGGPLKDGDGLKEDE